ncbi:hypothetical protein HU200_002560 [Digitaria exilis]|uniref:Reverse transcriptase zinc-binding domain-containing protein n=1 Tax=Digitaria exilis TaxID=1010633 RepID=A0A835KZ49_9POAL|nr:hypothetical protein HU200_002560 [Digitaria exilis]
MSVISFPQTTLAKLDRPRKGLFWAGAPKCGGGDCQVAWELACRSKEDGGLGLKDLATLNKGLMMRHVHKLFMGESNLWTDWIRFWYDGGRADGDTPCWRDIKRLIPEYRTLTLVKLGDGETTSFWHDTWSEAGVLRDALPAIFSHCLDPDATVAEVLSAGGLTRSGLQPRLTTAAGAELELLRGALEAVQLQPFADVRWVSGGPSTAVRATDFYNALRTPIGGPPMAEVNWNCLAPKKVQVFFWILRHDRTRTRASLHRHGARDTSDCPFYPGVPEETAHLFVSCPYLTGLWARLLPDQPTPVSVEAAVQAMCATFADGGRVPHTAAMAVLWVIWKSRNAMIFRAAHEDVPNIYRSIRRHAELWACRAPRRLDVAPLKLWCQTVVDVN